MLLPLAYATAALAGVVLALLAYAYLAPLDPLEERAARPGMALLAADGSVLHRDQRLGLRIPVALEDVAPVMLAATIAAEDQRFGAHPGIDPLAIARAAAEWRSNPSGASTLTQQLARRVYLAEEDLPLPVRKAREALVALQLEARYSKDELLEAYLNDVYYGRGAYGVEAAARVYFGVSARRLTLEQASLLAGLPQLPAEYEPAEHPAAAVARRDYVLGRMVATGAATPEEAARAAASPLALVEPDPASPAPHFVQFALAELARVRPDLAVRDGLLVETTLDAALQAEAERSVDARLAQIERHEASGAAVVALDPATGRLLAMVGGPDFEAEPYGQVNMATARRQPGSALKPFVYAAAFEEGYTAASTLLDVPTTFDTPSGPYAPTNYDLLFHGPVSVRVALASSLNVPAVRTVDDIGVDAFLDLAHRVGLRSLEAREAYGLAVTLGGGEVTLLELTRAYGAIAQDGRLAEPYAVQRVLDARTGEVVYERADAETLPALAPEHAFLLQDILSDPAARLLGFGAGSALETSVDAAVKTGTSSSFRDNWTVGFTSDRVVGVWVGNPDGRPMHHISGVDGAAPIWHDVIEAAAGGRTVEPFRPPEGLVRETVCAPTGMLPGPGCPSPYLEWFIAGTEPSAAEDYFVRRPDGLLAAHPDAEAQAWGVEADVRLQAGGTAEPDVHIVRPGPGAVLYIAPELPSQSVMLRASVPVGTEHVEFVVDGRTVGTVEGADARVRWELVPGRHTLEVIATLADGTRVRGTASYMVEHS